MNYGRAFRMIRGALGVPQKDLAKKLGLDPSYLSLLESGKRVPSTSVLEGASKLLGVPLHLIMLLATDKDDLKGISEEERNALGRQLLEAIIVTKEVSEQ